MVKTRTAVTLKVRARIINPAASKLAINESEFNSCPQMHIQNQDGRRDMPCVLHREVIGQLRSTQAAGMHWARPLECAISWCILLHRVVVREGSHNEAL